jgi:predicted enzyme related to lactoylglutathione lyase
VSTPRTYEPGTIAWVDLTSREPTTVTEFYGGVFGWEAVSQGPVEQTGGYALFQLDGKTVAGIGPGDHPAWTVYIAVAHADDATALAERHSAAVLLPPRSVPSPLTGEEAGRMAVLTDPAGAVFAVWQATTHHGADVVDEPGTHRYSELAIRDVDQAKDFYGAVFGWEGTTQPFAGGTSTYTELRRPGADEVVAGIVEMNEMWPADVPAHWMVYFATTDTDATAAKIAEHGGVVSVPPFDTHAGRISVVNDPEGAYFSLLGPFPAD